VIKDGNINVDCEFLNNIIRLVFGVKIHFVHFEDEKKTPVIIHLLVTKHA
jgi:hypothetical protein